MNNSQIFIAAAASAVFFMAKMKLNSNKNTLQWFAPAKKFAEIYGVPVQTVLAVIDQESAGRPDATGSSGEAGLMQLKLIAVEDVNLFRDLPLIDKTELFDPITNIEYGTAFLSLQIQRAGNEFDGLRAYNQGFAGMDRTEQKKKLSKKYAREVMAKKEIINNELYRT